jgi:tRNA 2-thiouridine synthesizing protein A
MLVMSDNHATPGATIDARGLACPLPVLRLRKVLSAQPSGAVVELLATDRASLRDVPAFCQGVGHELVATHENQGVFRFTVRKA